MSGLKRNWVMKEIKILDIEEIFEEVEVYDIQVEDDESFIAEGIVAHNCLICAADEGRFYKYTEGTEDHSGPSLPRHPRCRCVYSPVTKSWAQLEKEQNIAPGVSQQTKGAFINVAPDIVSYEKWLSTLDPADAKDVLGPQRYKLWNNGKIKFSEMAKNNKVISVEELNNIALKREGSPPLYARADALTDAQVNAMSEKQKFAWESYLADSKKTRSFGELVEEATASKLGAEHIIGRKPFDMFLDNDWIEHKVLFAGRGQIRMKPEAIIRKKEFLKRYNGKAHTVLVDKRPGSPTYNKYFYRKGLGNFTPNTMMEVKDFTHLKDLIVKGRKKEVLKESVVHVPKSKTTVAAENYAKEKFGIKVVEYGGATPDVADFINSYIGGSIEKLGMKPKGLYFDSSVFEGKAKRAIGMAFEDGKIYFNPKSFASLDKIRNDMAQFFQSGQFSTFSEGHVVRHEMGHLKYFHIGGTEKTAAQKLTASMQKDLIDGIGLENIPKYVGYYGRKTQGEFYSEMWSKILNGEKLHPAAQKIMKDIEKGLKASKKAKIVENTKK